MECPTCNKENTLRSWEGAWPVRGIDLVAHGQRCSSCGEILVASSEHGRLERLAAAQLVARGIRTGRELKFVRKLAGLRANEVAYLFGVRSETVSRWERGEVEIPRTAAYALGQLFEHPKLTRQRLEAFEQPVPPPREEVATGRSILPP